MSRIQLQLRQRCRNFIEQTHAVRCVACHARYRLDLQL